MVVLPMRNTCSTAVKPAFCRSDIWFATVQGVSKVVKRVCGNALFRAQACVFRKIVVLLRLRIHHIIALDIQAARTQRMKEPPVQAGFSLCEKWCRDSKETAQSNACRPKSTSK